MLIVAHHEPDAPVRPTLVELPDAPTHHLRHAGLPLNRLAEVAHKGVSECLGRLPRRHTPAALIQEELAARRLHGRQQALDDGSHLRTSTLCQQRVPCMLIWQDPHLGILVSDGGIVELLHRAPSADADVAAWAPVLRDGDLRVLHTILSIKFLCGLHQPFQLVECHASDDNGLDMNLIAHILEGRRSNFDDLQTLLKSDHSSSIQGSILADAEAGHGLASLRDVGVRLPECLEEHAIGNIGERLVGAAGATSVLHGLFNVEAQRGRGRPEHAEHHRRLPHIVEHTAEAALLAREQNGRLQRYKFLRMLHPIWDTVAGKLSMSKPVLTPRLFRRLFVSNHSRANTDSTPSIKLPWCRGLRCI
mmetsp:Transcript_1151/g.2873  ORF Transcript_1151/g.2873 Transcript_1151/m.2873 type:complete len:362 (+) Transcript_1151:148-1233(+)